MGPAADDDFVTWRNPPCGQVLMLPSQHLVHPAADDDFVMSCGLEDIFKNAPCLMY